MTNNAEHVSIENERGDDIPVLLAQLCDLRVAELLHECFPTHGNWDGVSFGHLVAVWLTFLVSESNHRLRPLQPWAASRVQTWRAALGVDLVETEFTDDRLAQALDYLSAAAGGHQFEDGLTRPLIRSYDLNGETGRLDRTTAQSSGEVTAAGWVRFGHSKAHRPDLPQLKINVSPRAPLGLPLTATLGSGEKADDPLYVPEIERVRETWQRRGLLYVGESQRAALKTRLPLAEGGEYYLCPLPATQGAPAQLAELLAPGLSGEVKPVALKRRTDETGRLEKLAEGSEYPVSSAADHEGRCVPYEERRLVVWAVQWARAQKKGLAQRVKRAAAESKRLTQKKRGQARPKTAAAWQAAVEKRLRKDHVVGLLEVTSQGERSARPLRAYPERPATVRVAEEWRVRGAIHRAALEQAQAVLGWRGYATNAPVEQWRLTPAVLAYRGSPVSERGVRRLQGPLSLPPLYLPTPARLTGLGRVLLIGLRGLGLSEYKARRALAERGAQIAGLTTGLPQKATARPTTEALLRVFEGLTLISIGGQWELTPLNALQPHILELLGFSSEIYHRLIPRFSETQMKMSET